MLPPASAPTHSFHVASSHATPTPALLSRRCVLPLLLTSASLLPPRPAEASSLGYADDIGVKSYSQVQRAWENSAGMSQREIMLAARGAGNVKAKGGVESDRSKKRRAMAGCKDELFRRKAGYDKDEAGCNQRVLGGEISFMIEVMDAEGESL